MADPPAANDGIVGRVRGASLSIMNANPQLGMWQAAGTAIAQAPNLTELRDENSGGDNIAFNSQGHSARIARQERDGELALVRSSTRTGSIATEGQPAFRSVFKDSDKPDERHEGETDEARVLMGDDQANGSPDPRQQFQRRQSLYEKHMAKEKAPWQTTVVNGLKAFWKFFLTPSGFIITIYCLNIVVPSHVIFSSMQLANSLTGLGRTCHSHNTISSQLTHNSQAMLFFLLINAAPAMNYPSADDNNSPRKKWLEIDSQILNALFCVTGFGLAPWRFRDLYWFIRATNFKDREAMRRLAAQNKGWFRPPAWTFEDEKGRTPTFTNQTAPPTALWKLGFTIWMMVLNTLLQAVLCYFMWGYNRIDRPVSVSQTIWQALPQCV